MEYYDFSRLEVFRQYHNIQNDLQILDDKYKNMWKANMFFVCKEILKRYKIIKNKEKKESLLKNKEKLCEDVKILLSRVMINKLMLFMLSNNKVKLVCNEINSLKSQLTLTSKDCRLLKNTRLFIKKICLIENEDKELFKNTYLVHKQIQQFCKKFNLKFTDHKVKVEKEKIEKIITKSYDSIENKNIKLRKLIDNIINCDKQKVCLLDSITIIEKNCNRELKSHRMYLNYLYNKIRNVKKKYTEELKNVNLKYKDQFSINGEQLCSICLEEDCRFIKTECGHYFHVECLSAYIQDLIDSRTKIEIKCPMCRQYLK